MDLLQYVLSLISNMSLIQCEKVINKTSNKICDIEDCKSQVGMTLKYSIGYISTEPVPKSFKYFTVFNTILQHSTQNYKMNKKNVLTWQFLQRIQVTDLFDIVFKVTTEYTIYKRTVQNVVMSILKTLLDYRTITDRIVYLRLQTWPLPLLCQHSVF